MDSFEEEDVLRSSWNQSAPLGLLKRFLFVLSLLSSTILGTCPTKLVSPCRKRLVYAYRRHQDVLLVPMCRLERLHCQRSPPFCLLTWKNVDVDWSRDLFRLSRGAFWYNVALKVDGEGVTRTNSDNVGTAMLQQFESTPNCCNMLPQHNVALKIVRRAMLHDVDF